MRLLRFSSTSRRLLSLLALLAVLPLFAVQPARLGAAPRQCPPGTPLAGPWAGSFTGIAERHGPDSRLHDSTEVDGLIALTVPDTCNGDTTPAQGSPFAAWHYDGVNATRGSGYAAGLVTGGSLDLAPEGIRPGAQLTWQGATLQGRPGSGFDWGFCGAGLCGDGYIRPQPAPEYSFTIDAISDTTISGSFDVLPFAYFDAPDATVVRNHGDFTLTAGEVTATTSRGPGAMMMRPFANTTALAANGLHLNAPAAFLTTNAPNCAQPEIKNGSRTDVVWPEPCVDPGDAVTLFVWFGRSSTALSVGWSRDGVLLTPDMVAPPEPPQSWLPTDPLPLPRTGHAAILLQDGTVLVAGGDVCAEGQSTECRPGTATETFDPRTGSWTPSEPMVAPYLGLRLLPLAGGRVLALGPSSPEIYEPRTRSWTAVAPAPLPAKADAVAQLADGRVLSLVNTTPNIYPSEVPLQAQLLDPATGAWTRIADLHINDGPDAAVGLPDGRALVIARSGRSISGAEVYDRATNSWTPTGAMPAFAFKWGVPVLLRDGTLLTTGVVVGTEQLISARYDPATNTWSQPTGLSPASVPDSDWHPADVQLLTDGRAFIVRSSDSGWTPGLSVFDTATNAWQPLGATRAVRNVERLLPLADGDVLVIGTDFSGKRVSERFDAATGQWSDRAAFTTDVDRTDYTLTALPDGGALIAGGDVRNGQESCRYGCPVATAETLPGH